jgi:hypothetical protein
MPDKEKFIFSLDYQLDLLKFIVTDRDGHKALDLIDQGYFALLEHGIIADALVRYRKRTRKVPGATILKEELIDLFKTRDYANVLSTAEKESILILCNSLYTPIRDGDVILEKTAKWASYVELKNLFESADLLDFTSHDQLSSKIQKALNLKQVKKTQAGTWLLEDIKDRQLNRQDSSPVFPTPIRQINQLTNAGGYIKGSIIVILDKPKKAKTTTLTNIARGYLKMKCNVFFADFENGEDELSLRFEQQVSSETKKDVLSGEVDKKVQRILRKYKRLGGEVYIHRFPSGSTANDIQVEFDRIYQETGRRFQILMCDYAALMGSLSRRDDDVARISDVYLDLANLALKNDLYHIWTPHHVKREAEKREATKYSENDIAKCIDIVRHVQAIYGLNRTDIELDEGIVRMELVAQRDGKPFGRALFHADMDIQKMNEFKANEINHYEAQYQDHVAQLNTELRGDLTD